MSASKAYECDLFQALIRCGFQIIADVEAAHSLKIDYDEMELSDFERVPFFEKNAYIYSTELDYLGSSHHSISSKGHYIYRIHAQAANGHIQCYVPAFGSQGDWLSNGTGREPPPKALDFPGSAGTKFLFVIPPNNDFDRSQTTVHLDITNPLVATAANVTITYNLLTEIGGGISVEPAEKRVVIMPMSSVKVPMKSEVIYTWFSMPMQTIDHALIRITSDHPITVIVNNFAENGAGDIFAVWPFSMQGEHYAFSTPGRGNAIVYLIAQKRDVEINATIISADSEESTLKTVMAGHNSLYWRLTGARSLYTDGNSSYSVIVAVRKVPTKSSSTGKHSTDFMCFSPAPLENSVCSEHIHRISTTSSASSFLFTPVRNSNGTTVNVHGLSEKQTQLIAHPGQNPIVLSVRDFGSSLDLYTDCDNSSIEIVRLGDYNETELRDGVFMDLVPRWDQITTGATIFTTHAIGDEIVIITDLESVQNNFFFDYSYAWSYPSFTRAPYYGANIYLKKIISKHSGVHVLFSLGWYIVQIHGSDKNGHAYSYTPALYAHSVPVQPTLPPFTPVLPTTTVSQGISSTTTVSSTTRSITITTTTRSSREATTTSTHSVPVQPTSPAFTPVLHTTSVSQRSSSTTTVPSTMRSITMTTATTLSHRTTTTSGAHSGFVVNTIRCLLVIVALLTSSPWLSTVLISQLLSVVVIV
ncbi:hypothetical protein AB6A40_000286 [Gnathostoma spinigerum]|uniref:IgGFc-binding protein N-terminal domain-containing protein n=1 Tax=Gnathostoma spinigerum TaxID=75299 RepID=A0ABD6EA81_9BILA